MAHFGTGAFVIGTWPLRDPLDQVPLKIFREFDGNFSDGTRLQVRALSYEKALKMLRILGCGAAIVSCQRVG